MENDLIMQMAIANNEELAAYRATRLTPDGVLELQRKYDDLLERYYKEQERDLQNEIRLHKYAQERSVRALRNIQEVLANYFIQNDED